MREKKGVVAYRETGILAVHSHGNLKFLLHGLHQDNNLVGVLLWQQSKPDEPAAYFLFFGTQWNINTLQTLWAAITSPTNSTANDQRQRLQGTGTKAICNQHRQRSPNTDRDHCSCILEKFLTKINK